MSGSETGVISSREPVPFTMGLQNNPMPTQPAIQNIRLSFPGDGVTAYKPASPPQYQPSSAGAGDVSAGDGSSANHGLNMNMVGSEPTKKKRGRPRKYGPDSGMSLALVPGAPPYTATAGGGLPSPPPGSSGGASNPTFKKARGRPAGSGKKHQLQALEYSFRFQADIIKLLDMIKERRIQEELSRVEILLVRNYLSALQNLLPGLTESGYSGSTGLGFTPHVITVKAGEDVSSKIMAFSQHGPRAVCVLSANGAISNVTLRQPATSGGTVTYEGRFEILSLSGSFLLMENGGHRSRTGGLSVSLSGPDGRVLGGGVAGLLIAASPVQVVVASFISDGRKEPKRVGQSDPSSAPPPYHSAGIQAMMGPSSPQSRGTMSESSGGGPVSPLNHSSGACNNNTNNIPNMPWK